MQIISSFHKDSQTNKPKPGSYEWWYFDAMSSDDYSLVIVFYDGNPFSRRYIRSLNIKTGEGAERFPAISISVYKDGEPLFCSFEEVLPGKASFSGSHPAGAVGENYFMGEVSDSGIRYTIQINQHVANGDAINGTLIFEANNPVVPSGNGDFEDVGEDASHVWNLVLPACKVRGNLKISGYTRHDILFEGKGYHDHNIGTEPMKDCFAEWYWGRYHIENTTFIYYLMNINGQWDKKAWLMGEGGIVSVDGKNIELEDKSISRFGLNSSRKIRFNQNRLNALIQKGTVVDNGPFYQRFEGRIIIEHNKRIKQGRGISEYMYPSRITNRLFWPLVNMRIAYPGKPHWVQKRPVLYRWTW